jgi:hypothetical protein
LVGGITLHSFAGVSASASEECDDETQEKNKLNTLINSIKINKEKLNNWKKCQVNKNSKQKII